MRNCIILFLILLWFALACSSPNKVSDTLKKNDFAVIAYYSGNSRLIDSFAVEKLTHIIFSFGHLKGNRLSIDNANDTATIQKLVTLKNRNARLKVILSLGGWGGCEFCSPVFAKANGRNEFAGSVKELLNYFKADGIDLDWEYPAISGHPGHAYAPEDRENFTALIRSLRDSLGSQYEISFAAGGFDNFLQRSVEWDKVMPLLDKVNLMSYDLVHGYSKVTGHHTPLFSNNEQKESADNVIRYLDSIGVPLNKLIIGAAFYARIWSGVPAINNGLYQPGVFESFVGYNQFDKKINSDSGFVLFRDPVARAPYAYNEQKKKYATFDDPVSIREKTNYVVGKGLGGIMFWELSLDKRNNGLLYVIDSVKNGY